MKKATLIAALIGIGVTKVNAEKMASLTPDDGTDAFTPDEVTAFTTDFKGIQKDLLKNDSEFVSAIQSAEKAKNFDQFERKMKQTFGLTTEEIKDKKFDEIIAIAKTKIGTGDKDTVKLQADLLEMENKYKELQDVEIPKIRAEVDQKKKAIDLDIKFRGAIPQKDETGADKLRMPFDTVHKLLSLDRDELYDVSTDDKGEWVIKQKGTDLLAKSADGTKFLTMDEFVNGRLEHHKALVKSNGGNGGGDDPTKKKPIIEGQEVVVKTPAMLKAEKNLETLKASSAPTT